MRTLFLAISLLLASTCAVRAGDESVLWWMFDETTEINDINGSGATFTIDTLVGRGDAAGKTVNAIRIGAYDGDTLLGYLTINDGGPGGGNNLPYYSMPTEDFDTGGESWNAGPTYANLGSYATMPEVSFMIELGNWDASLGAGNEWQILAHSDPGTMESLKDFLDVADFDMHTTLEWTGGSYSVPEPSSGLLILIGGALLALRRRRRAA
ncbi:MAG: PEP-CTERM sorting domain-containing protein [bacterium]|nr:PEP-CTERM sorting domain-containing protein [bacterium]